MPMQEHEELPTGKTVLRTFDEDGHLVKEMHFYGGLDVAISIEFIAGVKAGETYLVKQRLVSRKRYEKVRVDFPDMPAPDAALEDVGGELLKAAQAERRQRTKAAKAHVADPTVAAQIDSFCKSMMEDGAHADAVEWIASPQHTLGEFTHGKSRKIVEKLLKVGAERVYACQIEPVEEEEENTGHLVVELPTGADERKAILREVDRLASEQGLHGDMDNGQRYAYVKLD
jgi:hypothetical protein